MGKEYHTRFTSPSLASSQAAGSSTFYSESSTAQSQSVAAGESVATGTIVQVQFSTLVEDGAADFYEIT